MATKKSSKAVHFRVAVSCSWIPDLWALLTSAGRGLDKEVQKKAMIHMHLDPVAGMLHAFICRRADTKVRLYFPVLYGVVTRYQLTQGHMDGPMAFSVPLVKLTNEVSKAAKWFPEVSLEDSMKDKVPAYGDLPFLNLAVDADGHYQWFSLVPRNADEQEMEPMRFESAEGTSTQDFVPLSAFPCLRAYPENAQMRYDGAGHVYMSFVRAACRQFIQLKMEQAGDVDEFNEFIRTTISNKESRALWVIPKKVGNFIEDEAVKEQRVDAAERYAEMLEEWRDEQRKIEEENAEGSGNGDSAGEPAAEEPGDESPGGTADPGGEAGIEGGEGGEGPEAGAEGDEAAGDGAAEGDGGLHDEDGGEGGVEMKLDLTEAASSEETADSVDDPVRRAVFGSSLQKVRESVAESRAEESAEDVLPDVGLEITEGSDTEDLPTEEEEDSGGDADTAGAVDGGTEAPEYRPDSWKRKRRHGVRRTKEQIESDNFEDAVKYLTERGYEVNRVQEEGADTGDGKAAEPTPEILLVELQGLLEKQQATMKALAERIPTAASEAEIRQRIAQQILAAQA